MKIKGLWWVVQVGVLVCGVGINCLAQRAPNLHFRGTISDYTPATGGGPWEVRGQWSLKINRDGKAEFTAALNMERSDLGVMQSGGGDLNNPADRNAHTHHLKLVDGTVTFLPGGAIEVTGPATITANGNFPPPFGPSSTLTIEISGGNSVLYSNLKVTFAGDAQTHFGMQAVNGVVRSVRY
jgi:hypothetical protein